MRIVPRFYFVYLVLSVCLLMACANSTSKAAQAVSDPIPSRFPCVDRNIDLSDVVSASIDGSSRITVKDKLSVLKARCRRGKLVDARGRQIRFYHLVGCWGNPPLNYQEILERQRKDLADLKKKYAVVEMTCNPNGIAIP